MIHTIAGFKPANIQSTITKTKNDRGQKANLEEREPKAVEPIDCKMI